MSATLRINAYVLAADPAWIEASVLSYYDHVGRIVVSYDENARGWTGVPIDSDACIRRLRAVDRDGKIDFREGDFSNPERRKRPMESETHQRQTAFDQAATDADWVVQLDADEVITDAARFFECLKHADAAGAGALDYPARWLYKHVRGDVYLEQCRRGWRAQAGYPGPMAARAGARFVFARQGPQKRYRVDFSKHTTDPSYPRDTKIDEVVGLKQGIAHFSWTRSDAIMDAKANNSSHAHDFDWRPLIQKWRDAGEHPYAAVLRSQLERGNLKRHLRFARISLPTPVTLRLPGEVDLATGELRRADVRLSSQVANVPPREAVAT